MYKRLAGLIAGRIEQSGLNTRASAGVYRYGAEMLISSLGGVLSFIALSLLFREPLAGFVYYLAFSIQRSASGGFHASTHKKCYLCSLIYASVFFVALLVVPPVAFFAVAAASTSTGTAVIWLLAPVGTPNKQLGATEVRIYRRRCRIILVAEVTCVAILLAIDLDRYAFAISNGLLLIAVMLIVGKISLNRFLRGARDGGV